MKHQFIALSISFFLFSCGGGNNQSQEDEQVMPHTRQSQPATPQNQPEKATTEEVPASERVALDNKGVGPIKQIELSEEIDQALATQGEEVYNQMCTACHKVDKRFIGPAPMGILERRSPEWIMNMILNPEVMVQEDPLAQDLLAEFNGSPMANQGLTEEQARAILEYFRTL